MSEVKVNKISPRSGTTVTLGDSGDTFTGSQTVANAALQVVLNNRANSYPSIADQLDKIYHSGIDEWKKVIKTTKDKYPK